MRLYCRLSTLCYNISTFLLLQNCERYSASNQTEIFLAHPVCATNRKLYDPPYSVLFQFTASNALQIAGTCYTTGRSRSTDAVLSVDREYPLDDKVPAL